MSKTNAYELTDEEASLVEDFRQGHVALEGEWIRLSQKELDVIDVMRTGKFGEVTIRFGDGEPKIMRVALEILCEKLDERRDTLDLIPKLQEKYSS